MTGFKEREGKERMHRHSLSVSGVLTYEGKLLLVQDNNGKWGLPSGHAEHLEDARAVLVREIIEETQLDSKQFLTLPEHHSQLQPSVIWVAGDEKTSVGVVYSDLKYTGQIENDEWPVKNPDEEICSAKLFGLGEAFDLIERREDLRKPQFNEGQIIKWLLLRFNREVEYLHSLSDETNVNDKELEIVEKIRKWILEQYHNNLFYIEKDPLLYHFLIYRTNNHIVDRGVMISLPLEDLLEGPIKVGKWQKSLTL